MGKTKYGILIILALATLLRFIQINQSFWLDEAIGAIAARDFSYSDIITKFIVVDNHTPLYYLSLKFWSSFFGFSEVALRGMSILFGVLTVYLTYLVAKTLAKNNNIALLSSLLLATSQMHVYYSQEARMYAMAGFFASLAILSFIKAMEKDKMTYWAVFSLSILTMITVDYMPVFLLPAFFIYAFIKNKHIILRLVFSFTPLFLFGLFWLPILLMQITNYRGISNNFLFGGATIKQAILVWIKFAFGRLSFSPKAHYYLLVGLVSIPIMVSLYSSLRNKKYLLIWLWLIVPLAFSFVVSFWFPAFSYFRFLYILPAFYILIALANKKLLTICIIIFNLLGLGIYYFDENQQREQWRQAVEFIESDTSKNSIALFEFPEPFAPYRWYSRNVIEAKGATDSISAGGQTYNMTSDLIINKNKIYYFDYLRDVSDSNRVVEQAIQESGFMEVSKTTEFIGVGAITTYEKN